MCLVQTEKKSRMSLSKFVDSYFWLTFAIALSSLALVPDIPIWITAVSTFFWCWKLMIFSFTLANPSKVTTGFFSILFFVLIYLEFKTYLGKESATSYIVILASLKLLEFTQEKEKDFIILLGFFLTSAKFLFSYDLLFLFVSVPIYIVLTLNLLPSRWIKENKILAIKYLFKIFFLAAPLSLLLFFLFPRMTKTLTSMSLTSKEGVSGFSDTISPGSISELSLSNEIAFRIEIYHNKYFTNKNLYLKGLVLEKNSSGMNWGVPNKHFQLSPATPVLEMDYKLILEPSQQMNLYSLPGTNSLFSEVHKVFYDHNKVYRTDSMIEKRVSIRGSIGVTNNRAPEETKTLNLELLPTTNDIKPSKDFSQNHEKLKRLISNIKSKSNNSNEINSQILNFFKNGGFQYSLSPGIDKNLSLETFLFKTKKGYCEHYAAAHAALLRHSGVPARVVIGYQGGEYNSLGEFWTIRQKDAHAWVEYLNESLFWVLTDPISIIAPNRIELGGQLFSSYISDNLTIQEIQNKLNSKDFINKTLMWLENLNYQWNAFLIDFDFDKQKLLLKELNLTTSSAILLLFFILVGLSLINKLLGRSHLPKPYSFLSFNKINEWAETYHLEKRHHEGPLEWKKRILKHFSTSSNFFNSSNSSKKIDPSPFFQSIDEIFDLWIQISYASAETPDHVKSKYFTLLKKMKLLKINTKH